MTFAFLLTDTGLFAAEAEAAKATWTIAPPAEWAKPVPFERLPAHAPIDPAEGERWLLLDRLVNVPASQTFIRNARQILTVAGVQNGSQISIDFDPAYQRLTLHWVRVWRGSNSMNRLEQDKVKLVQREPDLERHLYNGEQSAVLVLPDIRTGDIIDYAFTLTGENPIFGGKFFAVVPLQLSQPIERLTTRVLWPPTRKLQIKNQQSSVPLKMIPRQAWNEYYWDVKNAPGLHLQDSLPVGYNPLPRVELNEFVNWGEVNRWALGLFTNASAPSPELARAIAEWRKISGRDNQVLAALRFIQEQVRYFGFEVGTGSHQPTDPATVFSRRFGDCKDKTLLLVTVLRALGVEAYPVLVNTKRGRAIEESHPSAGVFNHVIAQLQLDGRTYWVDPTSTYQRGPLAAHSLPGYQRGLIIRPGTTALTPIPPPIALPRTRVTEYFQLGGKQAPAELKVVTEAEGEDAEDLRSQFATAPRAEIEQENLKFYSAYYPGIRQARPVVFSDDEPNNKFHVTEFYTIEGIWEPLANDPGIYRCIFPAPSISARLAPPKERERTMPLGRTHPQHTLLRTEVSLPEAWPPQNRETRRVDNSAFHFERFFERSGQRMIVEYEYRSLAGSVSTNQARQYLQQLDEARQLLGQALIWE